MPWTELCKMVQSVYQGETRVNIKDYVPGVTHGRGPEASQPDIWPSPRLGR